MLHWKPIHPRMFEDHKLVFMGLTKTRLSWLAREAGVFLGRAGGGKVITNKTLNATIKGIMKCLKNKRASAMGE